MALIACDFDGTLVEHDYPCIGKEKPLAIKTLQDLIIAGHQIILWTCRDGEDLMEAMRWLENNGVYVSAANKNIDESLSYGHNKVFAHYYFDDRSFPPFPGWAEVRRVFKLDDKQ